MTVRSGYSTSRGHRSANEEFKASFPPMLTLRRVKIVKKAFEGLNFPADALFIFSEKMKTTKKNWEKINEKTLKVENVRKCEVSEGGEGLLED